jgi:hypothetical protein
LKIINIEVSNWAMIIVISLLNWARIELQIFSAEHYCTDHDEELQLVCKNLMDIKTFTAIGVVDVDTSLYRHIDNVYISTGTAMFITTLTVAIVSRVYQWRMLHKFGIHELHAIPAYILDAETRRDEIAAQNGEVVLYPGSLGERGGVRGVDGISSGLKQTYMPGKRLDKKVCRYDTASPYCIDCTRSLLFL